MSPIRTMTRASPFDRLRDIIDENFGMQPVMPDNDALSFLEGRLFAGRWEGACSVSRDAEEGGEVKPHTTSGEASEVTIGSLFSGIGGLELGMERAGLGPVLWQCEIDPFCRRVLKKHWPTVTRFEDVTQPREYPYVDVVCGGFPCQDVSSAGKRRGIGGAKSGLWYHFASVVAKVRPRYVVVENVTSGARAWLPTVRRQLCDLGYTTTAYAISAADVGAPHLRRRIFVIANFDGSALREQSRGGRGPRREGASLAQHAGQNGHVDGNADRDRQSALPLDGEVARLRGMESGASAWSAPPEFRGVDDGFSRRLDGARLRALGNAVVPQCAEVIGRVLLMDSRAS